MRQSDDTLSQETERETVKEGAARDGALELGSKVGRYILMDRLGRGGMGVVMAAYDPHLRRKVALKLLRPDAGNAAHEGRLLSEARAMAQLSHPNVVHVYDAAVDGGQLYIAMEQVDGTTLARWLRERRRPWTEVLAHFLAAGRGLAAAHAAGIVHRDFKPSNVLLSTDGRVLVTDFGLARAALIEPDGEQAATTTAAAAGRPARAFRTVTGTLLGTPAYMAPEQFPGGSPDARSDQFAFCVALYEALYRVHPFAATLETGAPSVLGELPARPPDAEVPRPIFAILTRGMAREPAARHQDMSVLLGELGAAMPTARRGVALAGAGVAGLIGLAALLFATGGDERDRCASADQPAATLWGPDARRQVEAAFRTAGTPGGAAAFARVDRAMNARVDRIRAMRRDACVASEVRHQESPALFDRRIQCLDRRAREVASFTAVFAGAPERAVMDRAVEAAVALPPVAVCADRDALLAAVPPPDDPAVRARVAGVESALARVDALERAGSYQPALTLAQQAASAAERLDYPPIRARAHFAVARMRSVLSESEAAALEARTAIELAAAAHDDAVLADAWILLYHTVGYDQAHPDQARSIEQAVVAAVARSGDEQQRGSLENARGAIALGTGDYAAAAEHFLTARTHLAAALGRQSPQVANSLKNAGIALSEAARYDEARRVLEEALAIRSKLFGPEHPSVGQSVRTIGILLDTMGQPAEALPYFERAAANYRASLPPDDQALGNTLSSLGVTLDNLDRSPEALPRHLEAIAILEKKPADNQRPLSYAIGNLGVSYLEMERYPEALETFQRALAIQERTLGPDHPSTANMLCRIGTAARRTGDLVAARRYCARSLAVLEKKLGPDHPDCAGALASLVEIALARGRAAEALPLIERVRAIRRRVGAQEDTANDGELVFLHGRVLLGVKRRREGLDLMGRGLDIMKKHGAKKRVIAEAESQLAAAR